MLDTLLALGNTLLLGAIMLALILGVACIAMAVLSSKKGAAGYQERIEYGFFGVSSLAVMSVLIYAIT